MLNQNEKYLLKFISCPNFQQEKAKTVVDVALKLGIKIKFIDENPIYQIIDEMNFSDYKLLGKVNE